MKKKMSKKARADERRQKARRVKEAVEAAKADTSRMPDPIESKLVDGEAVEVVGAADAPTTKTTYRFRGMVGTALPPYIAPPESPHAGKTMRPVKINGKVVGIPEDRLRSVERAGAGPSHSSTPAYRSFWDRVFGGRRKQA